MLTVLLTAFEHVTHFEFVFLFSDQKMVNRAIRELGRCTLAEQIDENTTHVVSGENRRTVKVLTGISRGLWIISLDWVSGSICLLHFHLTEASVESSVLT